MAALGAQSIASSYEQLLHVDRDGGGNTTTHVSIKDGDNGTTFGFTIASDALMMSSTNRLEFGDTGTYIHQSADGVLDLVSDTEIEINATTIDMNGALDLSGNAQLSGTVTVGADGSGTDVIFYSGTAGDNFTWDASEEKLTITGTNGQTALDVADGNLVVADSVDIEGDIDVNGTSNLDAVDIDGAVQIDAAFTSGVDGQGYDTKFFGDTASAYMMWDTSADDLVFAGAAGIDLDGDIDVNGTANLDNTDINGTLAVDGTTISLDATTSLNIDNSNTTNGITVGTATSAVPISIGHTTSVVTVNDELDVTGTVDINDTTDSSSKTTGALKVDGGVGVALKLFVGTDLDVDGTTNLDAVDIDGAVQIDNTVTVGADDQGYDVIFYGDTASSNMTWDTSADDLILNDSTLLIDQDDNVQSIYIDSEATTAVTVQVEGTANTSSDIIQVANANSLTTGGMLNLISNSSDTGTRSLAKITNDHASATGATALTIQQDAVATGIFIDQNGNSTAILIDAESTTSNVLQIQADTLTSGAAAHFYTDSPDNTAGNMVVNIRQDNAAADSTVGINVNQDGNTRCIEATVNDASFTANMVYLNAVGRSANSGFEFLRGATGVDSDIQVILRGDGRVAGDSAYVVGADYAEYFESKDGKVIAVGTTVKLDGDKVVVCESGDTPIGVIRPLEGSASVGNTAWSHWGSKYLTDDYGSPVMEEYSVTEWMEDTDEVKTKAVEAKDAVLYEEGDEIPEGKEVGDEKEAAVEAKAVVYMHKDVQYQTDKIPSDVTVPSNATVKSTEYDGTKLMRKKLNPDYDESTTYIARESRDEWQIVGLLGQIPITKGQPVADSWIKMKDVSSSVEMYFVK